MIPIEVSEEFAEQEMTILEQRMALKKRIIEGIFKLLFCDLDKLSAVFILQLQKDLEEWEK